jgi:hypothetical protein
MVKRMSLFGTRKLQSTSKVDNLWPKIDTLITAIVTGKDFMNAPWLFAEAYKYRRLHECFSVSKFWNDYDVFYRQKVLKPSTPPFTFVVNS